MQLDPYDPIYTISVVSRLLDLHEQTIRQYERLVGVPLPLASEDAHVFSGGCFAVRVHQLFSEDLRSEFGRCPYFGSAFHL